LSWAFSLPDADSPGPCRGFLIIALGHAKGWIEFGLQPIFTTLYFLSNFDFKKPTSRKAAGFLVKFRKLT